MKDPVTADQTESDGQATETIAEALDALIERHGGLQGPRLVEFFRALKGHGLTAFRDKFSASYLAQRHFEVATLIDVGVAHGTPELYEAFPEAKVLLVDPDRETLEGCMGRFPHLDADMVCVAAGAEDGSGQMTFMPDPGQNTLLRLRDDKKLDTMIAQQHVPIRRLDQLVREGGYQAPFGLKIDTEGYELEVLRGASDILHETSFILAEGSIKRRYHGGHRFSDVTSMLAQHGFELFDILNPAGRPPNFFDGLFLPHDDPRFDL